MPHPQDRLLDPVLNPPFAPQGSFIGGAMQTLFAWFDAQQEEKKEIEGTINTSQQQATIAGYTLPPPPPPVQGSIHGVALTGDTSLGGVDFTELSGFFDSPAKAGTFKSIERQSRLRYGGWTVQDPALLVSEISMDPADEKFRRHPTRFRLSQEQRAQTDLAAIMKAYQDAIDAAGRGGGGGPRYQAPDRRAVEEAVEDQMVLLLGRIDAGAVGGVVNAYLQDDKRRFEGASVDPNMTLLTKIRGMDSYQAIHENRPDSAPENTWVSSQRNAFLQGGGSMQNAEQRAIDLATVGGAPSTESAGLFEASRGNIVPQFFEKLNKAASFAASRVN